jgi:hypothetical protein
MNDPIRGAREVKLKPPPLEDNGPGKYDDACTAVRVATEASAVVLLVIDGNQGSGFSVQVSGGVALHLPNLLRVVADRLEKGAAQ